LTLHGLRNCSRCTVGYRIEKEPADAEAYRCDCGLRFWTYDEGDHAVVATSLAEVATHMPYSGGIRAANDNDPVRRPLGDSYGGPQFQWPFNTRFDDK
jgi:hypothetical protein